MSVKHNRYRVIIEQELSRVDLDMSTDLLIIPPSGSTSSPTGSSTA